MKRKRKERIWRTEQEKEIESDEEAEFEKEAWGGKGEAGGGKRRLKVEKMAENESFSLKQKQVGKNKLDCHGHPKFIDFSASLLPLHHHCYNHKTYSTSCLNWSLVPWTGCYKYSLCKLDWGELKRIKKLDEKVRKS